LLKKPDGVQRPEDVLRQVRRPASLASRINRRSISAASALRARFRGRAADPAGSLSVALAATLRPFRTAERALPVAVAAIVALASLLALLPNTPQGAVGGTQGRGTDLRIAIGGGLGRANALDLEGGRDPQLAGGVDTTDVSFEPVTISDEILNEAGSEQATTEPGPFLEDGTILTGYAPATAVEDGSDLIETYRVKSGDTLVTIARKFDVSVMTLWWANKLKAKDDLHIGQLLRVPSVNGLVITVKETDTLESLAAEYGVSEAEIIELNQLDDPTLVVGQVLILPGARGAPIPTPKPKPTAKSSSTSRGGGSSHSSGGGSSGGGPTYYNGGSFRWPVVGGGNYISQHYHYGHYGLDIAADYGSGVVAAAGGKVIFAGWKSNGGGWQVWVSHGDGLYTTYNHMSGLSVGNGQSVDKGQQVGRIGQSGHATGPHLHFEVWRGSIWDGGERINPLRYF
jgi:murein DD-endopeptidase MepM/ murein hydrolase activator NlpD